MSLGTYACSLNSDEFLHFADTPFIQENIARVDHWNYVCQTILSTE